MSETDNIPLSPPGSAPGTLKGQFQQLLSRESEHALDFGEGCLAFLTQFGGWKGLAREAWSSFTDGESSPSNRASILKNILGLFEAHARINKDSQRTESAMTEQELLEQAAPLFRELGISDTHSLPPAALPEVSPSISIPSPADVQGTIPATSTDGESPATCAHHPV